MVQWAELWGDVYPNTVESVLPVFTGEIALHPEGQPRRAYLKVLGLRGLLCEVLAALTGKALGLPLPDFALVWAETALLGQAAALEPRVEAVDDEGTAWTVLFASFAVGEMHRSPGDLPLSEPHRQRARQQLQGCRFFDQSVAFDLLIANEDRHSGNIIRTGSGFWLIDHSHAFGMVSLQDPLQVMTAGLADTLKPREYFPFPLFSGSCESGLLKQVDVASPLLQRLLKAAGELAATGPGTAIDCLREAFREIGTLCEVAEGKGILTLDEDGQAIPLDLALEHFLTVRWRALQAIMSWIPGLAGGWPCDFGEAL